MQEQSALVLLFCLLHGSCAPAGEAPADRIPVPGVAAAEAPAHVRGKALDAFDITQHTCALFVAMRSHALDESISFGRDLDDAQVHWNMCPGGTMVACATAPGANGEVVQTGIPWPYAVPSARVAGGSAQHAP